MKSSRAYKTRLGVSWQRDGDGLDPCCWPDTPLSVHLLQRARLVCCRELRLLPNTMSEHMQLSLALCRIGLYTVREYLWAALVSLRPQRRLCLKRLLVLTLLASPPFELCCLCFVAIIDQATAAAAASTLSLGPRMCTAYSILWFLRVGVNRAQNVYVDMRTEMQMKHTRKNRSFTHGSFSDNRIQR